jgi:L-cysteine S-thiosulfotransferase
MHVNFPVAKPRVFWLAVTALAVASLPGCAALRNFLFGVPLETEKPAAASPWTRYPGDPQGIVWPQTNWNTYNTLTSLTSPQIGNPPKVDFPITGDAEKGKKLAFDRSRGGGCVACHVLGQDTPALPGNVGPDLSTIGATRPDDWLFNYTYEPRNFNRNTVMPPWGTHKIYTVEEIKDIVAFMKTLRTPTSFKDPLNDPEKRPVPEETRDNLDPTENPGMFALDTGKILFRTEGPRGRACATCHARPETEFKTWAATMPRYEKRLNKVINVEEFVTRHARATTGHDFLMESPENIGLSVYLHHLANDAPIDVDTQSPGAAEALKRGEELMKRKIGQLNFSCTDCHVSAANRWIRGQYLTDSKGQVMHFPTWRTSRGDMWDIRKRFQWCGVAIRANELPPDAPEYGDVELALVVISQGLKLDAPGIRH